jgi:hypothetical protein
VDYFEGKKRIFVVESRGVRGPVWIGFEVKNQPIQNKNHVRFGSVWMIMLKKSEPIRSKYMRFNLDRFLDIQSVTCNFFY